MKGFQYYIIIVLQKVGYCLFFVLYKIFVKIKVVGRENLIGLDGPVILASNHTSELDATALPMVLPFFSRLNPIYFVINTKKEFEISKTFGWRSYFYSSGFLNLMGGYPINPGHKDYAVSLADHVKLLKKGKTVCIFPEGRRTLDGSFGQAHGGLGYLVSATKATVVPIAINTFFNISWQEFWSRRRKVTIKIGKPIKASEIIPTEIKIHNVEDFRRASQTVLDRIKVMMV